MTHNSEPAATRARRTRRMHGAIHVCPLSAVPETVARSHASHLITCLQDEIAVETPRLIGPTGTCAFMSTTSPSRSMATSRRAKSTSSN